MLSANCFELFYKNHFRYKIDDKTVISGLNSKKFLSHIETKKELTKYLAEASIQCFKDIRIDYVVSYETCSLSNLQNFPEEMLLYDHEEADTLMLLHAANVASRNPFAELNIYSPDTDVFLLTIFKYPELCTNTVFQTGRGENTRNIPIRYE